MPRPSSYINNTDSSPDSAVAAFGKVNDWLAFLDFDPRTRYFFFHDLDSATQTSTNGVVGKFILNLNGGAADFTNMQTITDRIGQYAMRSGASTNQWCHLAAPHGSTSPIGIYSLLPNIRWMCAYSPLSSTHPLWYCGLLSDPSNNTFLNRYGFMWFVDGIGSRNVTCTTTNGSPTITSSAAFTANDVGRDISGTGIPAGTIIVGYNTTSSVIISNPATADGTNSLAINSSSTWKCRVWKSATMIEQYDSGVTANINTWYLLEIRTNSDATAISFYLNGVLIYTASTAQRPTTSLKHIAGVGHMSGSGDAHCSVDYVYCDIPLLR